VMARNLEPAKPRSCEFVRTRSHEPAEPRILGICEIREYDGRHSEVMAREDFLNGGIYELARSKVKVVVSKSPV
jgi:hypothetical protein